MPSFQALGLVWENEQIEMSGLRVPSRGERECLTEEAASSEQRHGGELANDQRPGLPWVELWPPQLTELGLLGRSCPGGGLWPGWGVSVMVDAGRGAPDSHWVKEEAARGECGSGRPARARGGGWGKDEGLAVVWVKHRPRPVLDSQAKN